MKKLVLLIAVLAVCRTAEIEEEEEDYLVDDDDEVIEGNPEEELRELAAEAEDNTDTTQNWQDFSIGSSLSLPVSMNEVERYYIRFPCSGIIQYTLHLKGNQGKSR